MRMHNGKQVGFIQHNSHNIDKVMHNGNCVFEQGYPRDNNTITGDIVLDGTIGKSLKSWSITGNTIQDGTPSPDSPIEIQSVGERTKNLFDGNIERGEINVDTGTNSNNSALIRTVDYIPVSNKIYSLSRTLASGFMSFRFYDADKNYVGYASESTIRLIHGETVTNVLHVNISFGCFEIIDNNIKYMRFRDTTNDLKNKYMLVEGEYTSDTMPEYEPYGYKIPVVTRGKNLFDYKTMAYGQSGVMLLNSGELSSKYPEWNITDYIPCSGNVFTINPIGGIYASICLYDSQKNFITGLAYNTGGAEYGKPITIKSETNASYIRFSHYKAPVNHMAYTDLSKIQLEEGTTATIYQSYKEPITTLIYLDKPLQIGETLNSDGTRDVKWDKVVLSGDENWNKHGTLTNWYSFINNSLTYDADNIVSFCSHFVLSYDPANLNNGEYSLKPHPSNNAKRIVICTTNGDDSLDGFKAWLKSQYDTGTPVTVYYQIATPTTETIEVPEIPTFRNSPTIKGMMTSLSVDTTIKPTATNVSFRSTNKYQRYISRYIDFDNNNMSTISGDFSNIRAFTNRRRCNVLDDGTISAFYGDDNYTEDGSNGQVMVYQPKFYYKVEPIRLEPITDSIGYHIREAIYSVSDIPLTGYKLHPAFINEAGNEVDYFCLSAYEGCAYDVSNSAYITNDSQTVDFTANTGDKLSSIANVKPMSGLTQQLTRPNAEIIAKNRGAGWHSYGIKQASANQMLMFIEYGNLQSNIGSGVTSITDNSSYNCSSYTGSTSSLGNTTGRASSTINEIGGTETTYTTNGKTSISYRGMENPYGNIWDFVYGINIHGDGTQRSGVPYICTDYNYAESKNSGNYVSAGFTTVNANGYIKAFGYGNPEYDWLFMGSDTGGTAGGIIGDYHYVTANLNGYRIALLGGFWADGSVAGGFYWTLAYGVGARGRIIGARLCYIPQK